MQDGQELLVNVLETPASFGARSTLVSAYPRRPQHPLAVQGNRRPIQPPTRQTSPDKPCQHAMRSMIPLGLTARQISDVGKQSSARNAGRSDRHMRQTVTRTMIDNAADKPPLDGLSVWSFCPSDFLYTMSEGSHPQHYRLCMHQAPVRH